MIKTRFNSLCKASMDAYDETIEGVSYESTLVDILDFVKANESEKPFFISQFKEIMTNSKNMPLEAVSFCMRELRWFEIKEYASNYIRQSNDPRRHALITITEAYDEEWPDECLYKYFSDL